MEWYTTIGKHERLQNGDARAVPPDIRAFHDLEDQLVRIKRTVRHPEFKGALQYVRQWDANPPPLYVEPTGSHPAPNFANWQDFANYARHHHSSGTLVGLDGDTYEEAHPDVYLDEVEKLLKDPYGIVTFVDWRTQTKSKTGIRARHIVGNMTDRQKFAFHLVRAFELCGEINALSKHTDEPDYPCYYMTSEYYAHVFHLDTPPRIEYFIVGDFGDYYEENFSKIFPAVLNHHIPEKQESLEFILGLMDDAKRYGGRTAELASRYSAGSAGWAESR